MHSIKNFFHTWLLQYKSYICKTFVMIMELTSEEKAALNGEHGDTLQTAYRILVATGEATNAEKLIPITWAHLSGVNYNTIGDAGEQFLRELSKDARVKVKATVNPMGIETNIAINVINRVPANIGTAPNEPWLAT